MLEGFDLNIIKCVYIPSYFSTVNKKGEMKRKDKQLSPASSIIGIYKAKECLLSISKYPSNRRKKIITIHQG